jgi:hypothetical protein
VAEKPTHEEDVALVVDFVRRLRRVALHPLALEGQAAMTMTTSRCRGHTSAS